MFTVNKNPTSRELRKFGVAMLVGFGVIGALLWAAPWWKSRDPSALAWQGHGVQIASIVLWSLGAALLAASNLSAAVARPVYIAWMTFGTGIGAVVTTILLTLLFLVVLPIFVLIVRRSDPLRRHLKAGGTYWENYKPHEATLERMRRPF